MHLEKATSLLFKFELILQIIQITFTFIKIETNDWNLGVINYFNPKCNLKNCIFQRLSSHPAIATTNTQTELVANNQQLDIYSWIYFAQLMSEVPVLTAEWKKGVQE